MSSQILSATNKCQPGISFHYKFPKTGLSLRSVVIEEDGLPKLVFDGANCRELPTLTEEDVATVARVVTEGKRPEFFYKGFYNPLHPFLELERMYKQYCPQYLRGTSVGELLSEVDWSMKCLHVGTRSNESKTEFWSWQETSKLENLAVHMDFPEGEVTGFSILMTCDHVKVEESENEILFTGEPKMRITDQTNPMYSEYITHYYDSVAYYDEPRFLKMQELMKLIVAVEWMKEKGVTCMFNEKWLKFHTEKRPSQVKEVFPFPLKEEEIDLVVNDIFKQSQMPNRKIRKTPNGIEYTQTHETNDPPVHSKVVTKVRASYNDYDFLLEGLDCNAPITLDHDKKPLKPDVCSWSELYGETVPMPIKMVALKDKTMHKFNGGVMTRNTPTKVKERVTNYTNETVSVKASSQIQPQTREAEVVPKPEKPTQKPPTDASPNTIQALSNKEWTKGEIHGTQYRGGHRLQTKIMRSDQQRLKWSRVDTTTTNGRTETKGTLLVDQKTAITTKRYNDEDKSLSPTDSGLSSPTPNEILPVPPIPATTGNPQYNTGIPKANGPPSIDSGYSSPPNVSPPLSPNGGQPNQPQFEYLDQLLPHNNSNDSTQTINPLVTYPLNNREHNN